jgi:polyphosphate kinase
VIRRYAHLSTGNYNTITSQLYTDFGMFTCDEADATAFGGTFSYSNAGAHTWVSKP